MAIIDFILEIDFNSSIEEVSYIGKNEKWFKNSSLVNSIGKNIQYLFNASIDTEGGIVEIDNKFFKYQWIHKKLGATVFFSEESVLLDFYRQTISHVSEGIQIYDRNGYFLDANPSSEKIEKYNKDEFKGRHLLDLYDLKEDYSTVLTVLRTHKAVGNRCDRFKLADGQSLTTINYGYPLMIGKEVYGAVVFESDFTLLNNIKNRASNLETYLEEGEITNTEQLFEFDDIVYASNNMKELIHTAKKISLTDSSILINGDTGTGKELMAQSIHSFSSRKKKPFIDINCSAVPSNLFESLFFGTEKGAFTGSIKKRGFFELADGGTIFLDEINSISLEMQAKLLRVLQEKRFQRIGGNKYIKSDVRIIAASNQDLFELMENGKIRKDFYYRISTIRIDLPPLKERKDCVEVLSKHFLNKLSNQYNREQLNISEEVIDLFLQYDWPGNIRELQHAIEYAFNFTPEFVNELNVKYLPEYLKLLDGPNIKSDDYRRIKTNNFGFKERMEKYEVKIILDTLDKNQGNITKSAEQLGMSRQSLQYRMKRLNI